ncbi:MAG: hypothetical protein JW769_02400, partial [Parachlamydiales bacterium]|nr:hypothetical protein [Parachlamydiales bacterium]
MEALEEEKSRRGQIEESSKAIEVQLRETEDRLNRTMEVLEEEKSRRGQIEENRKAIEEQLREAKILERVLTSRLGSSNQLLAVSTPRKVGGDTERERLLARIAELEKRNAELEQRLSNR